MFSCCVRSQPVQPGKLYRKSSFVFLYLEICFALSGIYVADGSAAVACAQVAWQSKETDVLGKKLTSNLLTCFWWPLQLSFKFWHGPKVCQNPRRSISTGGISSIQTYYGGCWQWRSLEEHTSPPTLQWPPVDRELFALDLHCLSSCHLHASEDSSFQRSHSLLCAVNKDLGLYAQSVVIIGCFEYRKWTFMAFLWLDL